MHESWFPCKQKNSNGKVPKIKKVHFSYLSSSDFVLPLILIYCWNLLGYSDIFKWKCLIHAIPEIFNCFDLNLIEILKYQRIFYLKIYFVSMGAKTSLPWTKTHIWRSGKDDDQSHYLLLTLCHKLGQTKFNYRMVL